MLYKTRGIALNYLRYRETSIIAKIYTEAFGIQSYIVNGVRSPKNKRNNIAFFQPLTLLELVVYHKNREQTIHRISEIKCATPLKTIPYDFVKSGIGLFLTEILLKTLREEEPNEPLFRFLMDSVLHLDQATDNLENFHLMMLCQLAFYLGFGSENAEEIEEQLTENLYPHPLDAPMQEALQVMLLAPYDYRITLDRARRNQLLDALIFFYKIHHEGMGEIRSIEVLREIMG